MSLRLCGWAGLVPALLFVGAAQAADKPAAAPKDAAAAATTPPAAQTAQGDASRMGLTIMGDRETPLGLFITPWKNAYPPDREDRPALMLDETAKALDADTFRRQVIYDEAFSTYRRSGALP
jgi:hypothetical protein